METLLAIFLLLASLASPAAVAQDIFVTPIPNVPFSGTVSVQRVWLQPDGSVLRFRTAHGIGRDREGRIFNEVRALVPAASNIAPALIRIHIYDPQTRISAMLHPSDHTYTSGLVRRPPATEPPHSYASPAGNSAPSSEFTKEEDLGTRRIANVEAHGVRETQTIPADSSGTGKPIVITDEYWYSPDLHINLAIRHDDPRAGSVAMEVTQITLADPDPSLFQIPEDYKPAGAPHPSK